RDDGRDDPVDRRRPRGDRDARGQRERDERDDESREEVVPEMSQPGDPVSRLVHGRARMHSGRQHGASPARARSVPRNDAKTLRDFGIRRRDAAGLPGEFRDVYPRSAGKFAPKTPIHDVGKFPSGHEPCFGPCRSRKRPRPRAHPCGLGRPIRARSRKPRGDTLPSIERMSLADHLRAFLAEMLQAPSETAVLAEEPKREAMAVDAWRQRLSWSTRVSRALGVRGYDRLTAVGEAVQVAVANDPVRRLRAHRARVVIADEVVLDVPVGELPESFDHRPKRAGLFEVRTDWLDGAGELV